MQFVILFVSFLAFVCYTVSLMLKLQREILALQGEVKEVKGRMRRFEGGYTAMTNTLLAKRNGMKIQEEIEEIDQSIARGTALARILKES